MSYVAGNRAFSTKKEAVIYCIQSDFDSSIMIIEEKEIYWYEFLYRGMSPGCQPKDFIDVNHNKGKFGYIAYNRRLTIEEIKEYELKEVL